MFVSFQGTHGSTIYVKRYLSTMFEISDVIIDKEELAMALNIDIEIPDETSEIDSDSNYNTSVSKYLDSVSKTSVNVIVEKVAKILSLQGFACPLCPKIEYLLLPLSECKDTIISPVKVLSKEKVKFLLVMKCSDKEIFRFEITMKKECL